MTLALKTGEHFVCGAALFPAELPLLERVVGETTDCAADVSPHLFSCNLAFPNCCYRCGSTEDLVDEEDLSWTVPASPPSVRCLLAKNEDELHGPMGLSEVLLRPPSA